MRRSGKMNVGCYACITMFWLRGIITPEVRKQVEAALQK